jgi:hypothetical protein
MTFPPENSWLEIVNHITWWTMFTLLTFERNSNKKLRIFSLFWRRSGFSLAKPRKSKSFNGA